MTTEAHLATIAQIRQNMVSNCQWAVAHRSQFTYAEIRPYSVVPPRTAPVTLDCSSFATLMAMWSGAADPSGNGFNGHGNTDTMLAHSQHIPRAETQPGDFAVFGLNPSQHVVVLIQSAAGGNGALCVSHGRQGDPVQVALSGEIVAQPITFLRLMPGGAVPQSGPNPYLPLDVDGAFGPISKMALQRHLGVAANGVVGPDTIKALQRHVGVSQSGVCGAETTKGVQRTLNAHTF